MENTTPENDTNISQYSTFTLELPFYNKSSRVIPVTLANVEMGNFYGAENEQLNTSLTGIVLPWSNRIIFDYARGVWKSAPNVLLMASAEPSKRPYFHINGTALLPQVDR
ncbi:MAG: hypothetical protein AAGJ08_00285 [Cyanobacteria bacterium P01_H01_bin.35]